ncbi:hypothetical protein ACIOC2_08945 [Streptomyces sp. NPDC088337]|uniref:hypothetical protein n=1 Tax=unclassified Streptomyces TaxID=2593676 RepID=UPI00381817C7
MSIMTLEIDESTTLLDLDFETTPSSAFLGEGPEMSLSLGQCMTSAGSAGPTTDLCCASARTHTGC